MATVGVRNFGLGVRGLHVQSGLSKLIISSYLSLYIYISDTPKKWEPVTAIWKRFSVPAPSHGIT
jgi:hypothetical protein